MIKIAVYSKVALTVNDCINISGDTTEKRFDSYADWL